MNGALRTGTRSGKYEVRAEAIQGHVTRATTTNITVEPDRIAFISDRDDGLLDIYIMDADGTNVVRVTRAGVGLTWPSWSPDGRRITYDADGNIYIVSDRKSECNRPSSSSPLGPTGSAIGFRA